jgi:hypothetical protein
VLAIAVYESDFSLDPENLRYGYSSIFQGLAALGGIVLVFLTLAHQRGSKAIEEASNAMRRSLESLPGGSDYDVDPPDWRAIDKWLRDSWCEKNLDPETKALDSRVAKYQKEGPPNSPGLPPFSFEIVGGKLQGEMIILDGKRREIHQIRDGYYQAGVMLGKRSQELYKMGVVSWNTLLMVIWFVILMVASLLMLFQVNDGPDPPFSQTAIAMFIIALTIAAGVHFILYSGYMVRLLLETPGEADYFSYTGLAKPEKTDEILKRTRKSLEFRPVPGSAFVKEESKPWFAAESPFLPLC